MHERPSLRQRAALLAGSAYLALGIGGFVPGLTAHYGRMAFAGRSSGAELVGVFTVCVLLNALHMAIGLGTLGIAQTRARDALLAAGGISLALFVYGLAAGRAGLSLNGADNWLHLALAAAVLTVVFARLR